MPLAEAIKKIKANSSRWLREQSGKAFQWQGGYAAFSVSISHTDATVAYILNQKKHHEKKTFDAEFDAILKKHAMEG